MLFITLSMSAIFVKTPEGHSRLSKGKLSFFGMFGSGNIFLVFFLRLLFLLFSLPVSLFFFF